MSLRGRAESKAEQEEALRRARQAAADCDPAGMLEWLHRGFILDGLKRRLADTWKSLPPSDADFALALAVDTLYDKIRTGEKVSSPVAFLWTVAQRRAYDLWAKRRRESPTGAEELDALPAGEGSRVWSDPPDPPDPELQRRALAEAWRLLPRLGQQNVQRVMEMVLDAIEKGVENLPNAEISEALGLTEVTVRKCKSRGFERLQRLAREEGLTASDFDVGDLASGGVDEDEKEDER